MFLSLNSSFLLLFSSPFNDDSPAGSRQMSKDFFDPVNGLPTSNGGLAIVTTSHRKLKKAAGQDKFFDKDPITVKPHRRLRALSAERKTDDFNHTTDVNTVWVGMKQYKAATHKLPLNRAFKVKLPSIQQTPMGFGDSTSSSPNGSPQRV